MKIAYYCSNRTVFPAPPDVAAANMNVMADIAGEMIKRGHKVTIFASKGSFFKGAKIVDLGLLPHKTDMAFNKEGWVTDLNDAYRVVYISELAAMSQNFDIVHFHVGRAIFGEPFLKFLKCPALFTLHDDLNPAFADLMRFYPKANLVSVSNSQRSPIPDLNYIATVHNGIDINKIKFNPSGGKNLVYLSRIVKEKGPDIAIKAARKAEAGLDIFGPQEPFFFEKVKPLLKGNIKYRGLPKKFSRKWQTAFSNSRALIFPVTWEEPFGLVMIEAMAHGTPVIAFDRGAIKEVVSHNKTGFICRPGNVNDLAKAIKKIYAMPDWEYRRMRSGCRQHVEKNFSTLKMADSYESLYKRISA